MNTALGMVFRRDGEHASFFGLCETDEKKAMAKLRRDPHS
jgi:hypothetical protein